MKKIIFISMVTLGMLMAITGCCKKSCFPSIEVGFCDPPGAPGGCGYFSNIYQEKFQLWTWNPVTLFPGVANVLVTGYQLQSPRVYLPKANVTNYSGVVVRGTTVVFYWTPFGLFDFNPGPPIPIGAVGVDLLPGESKWVSGPWTFVSGNIPGRHVCLGARVFHPCDKWLTNNYAFTNFNITTLPLQWNVNATSFEVNFQKTEGPVELAIKAPKGIRARIVQREVYQKAAAAQQKEIRGITELNVKHGFHQELLLIIENVGADYKEGDSFDVTVIALQREKELSNFTVHYKIGK